MLPILVRDQFKIKVNLDKADWAPSISLSTTDIINRIYINGKSYKNSTFFNILIDDYIKVYTNKNKLTYIKIDMSISGDVTIDNINYFKPRNIWLDASFLKQFPNLETFIFGHYAYGTTNPLLIGKFTGDWAQYIGPKLKSLTIGGIDYGPGTDCIFNANNIPSNSIIEEIILPNYSGYFKANMNALVNLNNLPATLKTLLLGNGATNNNDINYVSGNLNNQLIKIRIGPNNITSNLNQLNDNLKFLTIGGNNTISGNFKESWLNTLTNFTLGGNNTISGIIPNLNLITNLEIRGNNTISELSNMPNLITISLHGNNKITNLDFNKYPNLNNIYLTSINLTGNIDFTPLVGNNIIFEVNLGLINSINFGGKESKFTRFRLLSDNTISTLPSEFINLNNFVLGGNNTVSELPNMPKADYVVLTGKSTISGKLLSKIPKATFIVFSDTSNINDYSSTTFPANMDRVELRNGSLTTDMVDQLLIDLSKTTWINDKYISIKGNNQARSSVSDSAVDLLKTKGVNVDVWDLDTKKIINYTNTNNYVLPSANHLNAINNLIIGMKTCGIWNLLDRFWLFSGDGSSDFKRINLIDVNKTRADFYGGLTISASGIQGNGTNAYVDTNFNPSLLESGQKYQLNDACHGGIVFNYPTSENSTSSYSPLTGTLGPAGQNTLYLKPGNVSKINQNNSNLSSNINISGTGLKLINRNNSSSVYFINKNSQININVRSVGIFNIEQFGLRGVLGYANIGVTCLMMGASIPFQVSQDFRTVFNTYLSAIGQAQIA